MFSKFQTEKKKLGWWRPKGGKIFRKKLGNLTFQAQFSDKDMNGDSVR